GRMEPPAPGVNLGGARPRRGSDGRQPQWGTAANEPEAVGRGRAPRAPEVLGPRHEPADSCVALDVRSRGPVGTDERHVDLAAVDEVGERDGAAVGTDE